MVVMIVVMMINCDGIDCIDEGGGGYDGGDGVRW